MRMCNHRKKKKKSLDGIIISMKSEVAPLALHHTAAIVLLLTEGTTCYM